jgi:hypothetical protein
MQGKNTELSLRVGSILVSLRHRSGVTLGAKKSKSLPHCHVCGGLGGNSVHAKLLITVGSKAFTQVYNMFFRKVYKKEFKKHVFFAFGKATCSMRCRYDVMKITLDFTSGFHKFSQTLLCSSCIC